MTKKDQQFIEENEKTDKQGRPPCNRYLFDKNHPQFESHLLVKRSIDITPVLVGPQIPNRTRDDMKERYSRSILTLFIPWRKVTDLCQKENTWVQALEQNQNALSATSQKTIDNIQLLHECKNDRDEHLLQVIEETNSNKEDEGDVPLRKNFAATLYDDDDDVDDLLEFLDTGESSERPLSADATENSYVESAAKAMIWNGRFYTIIKS
ncbi:unnamed protein product [Didymodactylos carnosus]|uniref:Uncharacterized protein n=1 Tax=Didymodactylos carnosus TaxID=1234261 RepID=A0A8S2YI00_9BILA|nr:unnamed protein product [Didymodactylos carnosus]